MRKRLVARAALVAAGMLVTSRGSAAGQACGQAPQVEQRTGAVLVQLPASGIAGIPLDRPVRLTLTHPELGETSVVGRAQRVHANALEIVTSTRLRFLPTAGTLVSLSDGTAPAASCGSAEFGISCYLTGCIGTVYCLPGDGPGGFACTCT